MSVILLVLVTFFGYWAAYHTYGRFLARKIFKLNPNARVPATVHQDGVDYVPSDRHLVFGHHFTSIAGTGPIVGPAIGVIWGWVPAMIWIFFGSIFMGAVHDFSALVISLRNDGKSISHVTEKYINPRVRFMFFMIVCLALWIVIAIFGLVIALIFARFPESVVPVWAEIPIALALGVMITRRSENVRLYTWGAKLAFLVAILLGYFVAFSMPSVMGVPATGVWTVILLIYAYLASVLPVTRLLQPRDYLNAWQLYAVLALVVVGIIATHFSTDFKVVAPAFQLNPAGAPPMWPFLFITIACGAISGFHCLVASGTSAKQLKTETDAQFVGYGAMVLEAALATLVVVAVTAGIGLHYVSGSGVELTGLSAWQAHYASWAASAGLGSKLDAVVIGFSNITQSLGIPLKLGTVIFGVFIASFAGTTLDSATRVQRYVIQELSRSVGVRRFSGTHSATIIAVVSAAVLAFSSGADGKGALQLWPLFGAVNQLLGGLALLVGTVYLRRQGGLKFLITGVPCLFLLTMTLWAGVVNQFDFYASGSWLLLAINGVILTLSGVMFIESLIVFLRAKGVAPEWAKEGTSG